MSSPTIVGQHLTQVTTPDAGTTGLYFDTRGAIQVDSSGSSTKLLLGGVNSVSAATYTVQNVDEKRLTVFSYAGSVAVTLPQAGTGGSFQNKWVALFTTGSLTTAVITPTVSQINGVGSITLSASQSVTIFSDGTNYFGALANSAGGGSPTGAAGGDLTGTYPNPTIAADAVTYAKMQNVSDTSRLLGRWNSGSGNVEEIPLGGGLSISSGSLVSSTTPTGAAGGDLTGTYPNPTLRNSVGYSVIGRASSSTGHPDDIGVSSGSQGLAAVFVYQSNLTKLDWLSTSGASAYSVVRMNDDGSAIQFSLVTTDSLAADAVTYAKMQNVTATSRLLGRVTAGAGDVEEIPLGTGLAFTSGSLGVGTLTTPTIINAAETKQTLTDAATIAWDMNLGGYGSVTITASRILGTPTNIREGATYWMDIIQGGAGGFALTYTSIHKFPGGIVPVLSTAAGAVDTLSGYSPDGINIRWTILKGWA